jgi:hypothetical protein
MAPWSQETGIRDSTIFTHTQHWRMLKKEGNFQQEVIKAVNYIPHLDITSEDKENEYVAVFANRAKFHVQSDDPDKISAMKKDKYILRELEGNVIVDLDIEGDVLNEPFTKATKQHNYLVDKINEILGGRKEKKGNFFRTGPSSISFSRLQEPVEAT